MYLTEFFLTVIVHEIADLLKAAIFSFWDQYLPVHKVEASRHILELITNHLLCLEPARVMESQSSSMPSNLISFVLLWAYETITL